MNSEGPSNPRVTISVTRQLNQLRTKAPDGVKIIINDTDIFDIQAELEGPVHTPYEGGVFRCKLILPHDFPKCPPKGYFSTKIFHPNVSEKGEICVNTLKKDWNHQNWSFYNIFEVIKCLLIIPFPESALNEEAGKRFMEDYDSYFKHAKLMTDVHAQPKQINKMDMEKEEASQRKKEEAAAEEVQIQIEKSLGNKSSSGHTQQSPSGKQQIRQDNQYLPVQMNGLSTMPQNMQQQQQQGFQQITLFSNNVQPNQYNQGISNVNSPYKDSNRSNSISNTNISSNSSNNNNNQFVNGNNFQKSQNQENLQYQTNSSIVLLPANMVIGSTIQEEPLSALSKNSGYYSNSISQGNIQNGTQLKLNQPSQMIQNKNNVQLNLTFNNFAAITSSYIPINTIPISSGGKQQTEKKKWLKRI